ncbi:MAG: CotH kinase family protein [Bacteroidales bacterium]|jgi:hypothetical protein|nr:CotH kinase family protein [Bacteroidales bacterium]
MKSTILVIVFIFSCCVNTYSKPVLRGSQYLIATLFDGGTGALGLGDETYSLAYYADRDSQTATDSYSWLIKNVTGNEYTFQNAENKKYINYEVNVADREALVLVDSLMSDKSTSFSLDLITVNDLSYYVVHTVINSEKVWDRRTQIQGNIYPVGVFNNGNSSIQSFIFYDIDGNAVVDDGKEEVIIPTATQSLGVFSEYFDLLTFDNKVPVVDSENKELYLSVPEFKMNSTQTVKINYSLHNTNDQLYINKHLVISGSDFSYTYNADKVLLEIRNGATILASGTIVTSCLPLVQLYSDDAISAVYNLCRVVVTEPEKTAPSEIMLSKLKLRGDFASRLAKKAYAIKLKEVDGKTAMKRSFFGLRSDNSWILDAMFIDPVRSRNRVSTDLWLDFSRPTYYAAEEPKMFNGTRGKFVEVFLDDRYNGLYCMTEKIDRKQLKLKKFKYSDDSTSVTQRGGLYKASSWSVGTHLGSQDTWGSNILPDYNNQSESWTAFDVKYPDLGDGEPVEWKPVYDAVTVSHWKTEDAYFSSNVASYFDLPVFEDYYLFLDLLLATDNHGKNYYLSVYDQTVSPMVSLTPWDLDGVWGRRWDGTDNRTFAQQSFENYIIYNEPKQNNLYLRMMKNNTEGFNDKLKSRYKELRGTYFSHRSLMDRFNTYNELFTLSGAAERERNRWGSGNMNNEIYFLSNWIETRLDFLDMQYLDAPYTDIADITRFEVLFAPNPVAHQLTVFNTHTGEMIEILSLQGNVLMQIASTADKTVLNMDDFKSGIYLIKVCNRVSKMIKK